MWFRFHVVSLRSQTAESRCGRCGRCGRCSRCGAQVCQCSIAATFVTGDPKTHTVLKAHFGKKIRPEIKVGHSCASGSTALAFCLSGPCGAMYV